MLPFNNPQLVRQQYATDDHLRLQRDIERKHSITQPHFPTWVLQCYRWRGDEVVLDLGAGPGWYHPVIEEQLPNVTYYALDISPGLLAKHPARGSAVLGDAQTLPFANHTFDVVMANHVLYHLADMDSAIEEIRRVLKADGSLMAATNSVYNMPEFHALFRRAILLLSAPGAVSAHAPPVASELFSLESGTRRLARHFFGVVRYDLPDQLVFRSAQPAIDYIDSTRGMRESQLPAGVRWVDAMMIMRQQLEGVVEYLGELVVNTLSGVLIASNRGGIFREFVEQKDQLRR